MYMNVFEELRDMFKAVFDDEDLEITPEMTAREAELAAPSGNILRRILQVDTIDSGC